MMVVEKLNAEARLVNGEITELFAKWAKTKGNDTELRV